MITFKSSILKSTRLIENGKYHIKQYVSPETEPVRRRYEHDAQRAPRT